jgi:hypothetical protein
VSPRGSDLERAALAYAERGWPVFPVAPRRKTPATEHGFKDASDDPERIASWWRGNPHFNIGIATGAPGVFVVDLDGSDAIAAWADLAAQAAVDGRAHERTLVSITGRGLQVWFSAPPEAAWARNSASRIAPGIDTRGAGGYAIAPPSVHPSGRRYRWLDPTAPLAPAPNWLAALLEPPPLPPRDDRRPLPSGVEATPYGRAALDRMSRDLRAAGEGVRHHRMYAFSCEAGELGAGGDLGESAGERVLVDAGVASGLTFAEAARTFRDGWARGFANGPRRKRER